MLPEEPVPGRMHCVGSTRGGVTTQRIDSGNARMLSLGVCEQTSSPPESQPRHELHSGRLH